MENITVKVNGVENNDCNKACNLGAGTSNIILQMPPEKDNCHGPELVLCLFGIANDGNGGKTLKVIRRIGFYPCKCRCGKGC